ncbi:hypothetical protein CVT26_005429 [Gymnopilus dilepis]|uniref:Nephrocystin 3-like N-terminal domain-containing protein n=1 Tax=Gymnopilus dilepis TaxID=231916 RepID=A0A409W8I0_9AGAR|nr:hypothetical protein CVT26_005429 [Gymnopilus dilepis]
MDEPNTRRRHSLLGIVGLRTGQNRDEQEGLRGPVRRAISSSITRGFRRLFGRKENTINDGASPGVLALSDTRSVNEERTAAAKLIYSARTISSSAPDIMKAGSSTTPPSEPTVQAMTPEPSSSAAAALNFATKAVRGMQLAPGVLRKDLPGMESVENGIDLMYSVSSVLEALKTFFNITEKLSTIHPYVQLACTILGAISKVITEQADRDRSVQNLLVTMRDLYMLLNNERLQEIQSMKTIVQCICQQTLECSYFIEGYTKNQKFRTRIAKNLSSHTDSRIAQYQQVFEELRQGFETRASLETLLGGRETLLAVNRIWDKMNVVDDIAQSVDLNSMPYAGGAGLNLEKVCLEGTRKEILNEIMEWASSTDESRVFWLHGNAGKGKSAIAHTIAHHFQLLERLGSCFCFDRNEAGQKRYQTIFTTIARDLSDRDEHLRAGLQNAVHKYSSLKSTTDILQQWKEFIVKPIMRQGDAMAGPIVIVIDALDESGDSDSRKSLLRVLAGKLADPESRIQDLPPNFRFLVTSRLLPDIHQAFKDVSHVQQRSMDDILSTGSDISTYIQSELSGWDVSGEVGVLERLTVSSNGLFEWARLACAYIANDNYGGLDRRERFELITSHSQEVGDHLLDDMYRVTLEVIFPKSPTQKLALRRFHSVMAQVICTAEPLSMASLESMRNHFCDQDLRRIPIKAIIEPMGALLSGTTSLSITIRPLHASFIDFLTDDNRSAEFFVDVSGIDNKLAFSCLRIMEHKLKFNICGLSSSYLANFQVPDLAERIDNCISSELSYSCRLWTYHLHRAIFTKSLAETVRALFGHERLLFWLEVLTLLTKVNTCYAALSSVIEWVSKPDFKAMDDTTGHLSSYKDIRDDAADAQRFVRVFGGTISFSTPHLYVSALPFSPAKSRIFQKFAGHFQNTLKIIRGQHKGWPVTQAVLRGHTKTVNSVAFSPDGRRIISGSSDKTIRIWDAETGESLPDSLARHQARVHSVGFSPDGKKIVSGSKDKSIRLWDSDTGEALRPPIEGHSDWVRSVAFSPDGKQICSASGDRMIHLWSTETGHQLGQPLRGHANRVTCVAFSPDGRYIVSASLDWTVRLWDVESGKQLQPVLNGHSDCVWSVAFSPDGNLVVSGSNDCTVRLWDITTMEQLGEPLTGHTRGVLSVAFSPDGSLIVSGSEDTTVRLWSVETQWQLGIPLKGHENRVWSVTFSPDGRRIVSGSEDTTLRLWDTGATEEDFQQPQIGHAARISAIAFSPDGRKIASGSRDKTVRLWDTDTGKLLGPPLNGHEKEVNTIAFSPDGKILVSGSDDETVRVWNTDIGEQLMPPLRGHTDLVTSVAFSPDGKLIASGSLDKKIWLWDADTGEQLQPSLENDDGGMILSIAFSLDGSQIASGSKEGMLCLWGVKERKLLGQPFEGHKDWVRSVAFSPDGGQLASGSGDKTIRLWSTQRGQDSASLLRILLGHQKWIYSVLFSSDGQRVISGSQDRTIRIWDTHSGQELQVIRGHEGRIFALAYSPAREYIASGSDDKTIRVWYVDGAKDLRQRDIVLDKDEFFRTDKHLISFSTCWNHSLRDNRKSSTEPYMSADLVEVDGGWTWFQRESKSYRLFWAPQPYHPVWLHQYLLRVMPAPEIELNLSQMAHGSDWHSCYSAGEN